MIGVRPIAFPFKKASAFSGLVAIDMTAREAAGGLRKMEDRRKPRAKIRAAAKIEAVMSRGLRASVMLVSALGDLMATDDGDGGA
jgi:hypothetical protein